jgi:D-threo-aldose 1-dehydrogenase
MKRHATKVGLAGTGLEITRLGLGTGPLAGMGRSLTEEDSDLLIAYALDQGINFFDTAPFYGFGKAEVRLGRGLLKNDKPYVLETKVGRVLDPAVNPDTGIFNDVLPGVAPVFDLSADGVKRSIDESLDRLGLDHIDIALMHDIENHMDQAIKEAFPVLAEYRAQGIIKGVGTGLNYCAETMRMINECDLDVVLIAGRYTLLDQEAGKELIPLAQRKGVAVLAAGVFNSGILANPRAGSTFNYAPASDEVIQRAINIGAFLNERGVSLTAAALQFPIQNPGVTTVVIGASDASELEKNINEFNLELPIGLWDELREAELIN